MLELPHAAVGATIAVLIPNPLISVPLALASHFAMDLFPHWNPHINREIRRYGRVTQKTAVVLMLDSGSAAYMGFSLAQRVLPNYPLAINIIVCCFMAVLPDIIEIPVMIFRQKVTWLRNFGRVCAQFQYNLPAPAGIYTQLFVLIICFVLIFRHLAP